LSSTFCAKALGSDFSYSDIETDFRNFFEVLLGQVIAVQTGMTITGGTVPFQNLARFGGQNFIRGYFDGQYRDKTGIGGQVDYRFPIWWRFGGVAFAGIAQVADEAAHWRMSEFKLACGGGLRFLLNPHDRVTVRLDVGFGNNSSEGIFHRNGSILTEPFT